MPFLRMASRIHAEVVVSHCAACGGFVGASPRPTLLSAAEAVHRCPSQSGRKPVASEFNKSEVAKTEVRKPKAK